MEKDESCKKYNRGFLNTTKGGALIFGGAGALVSAVVIANSVDQLDSLEYAVKFGTLLTVTMTGVGAAVGYFDEKVLGPAYNYICKFTHKNE